MGGGPPPRRRRCTPASWAGHARRQACERRAAGWRVATLSAGRHPLLVYLGGAVRERTMPAERRAGGGGVPASKQKQSSAKGPPPQQRGAGGGGRANPQEEGRKRQEEGEIRDMTDMVLEFLIHAGFDETVAALKKQLRDRRAGATGAWRPVGRDVQEHVKAKMIRSLDQGDHLC
jgi:hypothetical protein